ncbi:MAG: S-methyl-5'-thioinosine phosphorylase [Methylococcaceae bacterium]|nr:S-methyl-5'-thioinosine phosphorylase [Methylococcaceae bacterium]
MSIGIIGGTGLTQINSLNITGEKVLDTPFGKPSASYVMGKLEGKEVVFLARHGNPHVLPPHKVNYRANIWGFKQLGIKQIISVAAVGGITENMAPAHIAIPDQVIDYSYGREHTFFADDLEEVTHIDFTYPYTPSLRAKLINLAAKKNIAISPIATYGCTQGPRLETAAEIARMERDGCDIVGMTGMPEAALAREAELDYAAIAVVANWGAGKIEGEISMDEIHQHIEKGMGNTLELLTALIREL